MESGHLKDEKVGRRFKKNGQVVLVASWASRYEAYSRGAELISC